MNGGIGAVIMVGGAGDSPQEQLVLAAQRASTLDLIALFQARGVAPIVVAAPTTEWLPADLDVIRDIDSEREPFHFGNRLADLIERYTPEGAVLYFGGGSAPLLDGAVSSMIVGLLDRANQQKSDTIPERIVLTNNLHSSDWAAISRADAALPVIREMNRDNSLAWLLQASGDYDVRVLSSVRPATSMDLDTPSDVALVARHPDVTPALLRVISEHDRWLRPIPIDAVIAASRREGSTIALIGRVSPLAWQAFNKATRCWTRVIAEERGMVASGRIEAGQVRSALTPWLKARGVKGFFADLADMADAAIFDSRVLFAAQGLYPDAADRFASDLLWPDVIKDPWVRAFTEAAADAPLPVILGGHSVVAGGLYALAEIIERGA
ncbi:MAG: hypothetical protein ACYDBJ_22185 [Aggregatilineales bacterium]